MIRILIVDDQNLVQQGIKSLLERDREFKIIGTLNDGRETIERVSQLNPDIVLLDIEMPGMDGITATKYIARVSPDTKVIILSSHEDKKYVTQALIAGAKGYLLKSSLMTDLKQAIVAVNNGYSQIDSRLLAKVFDRKNIKVKLNKSQSENEPDHRTVSNSEISQTSATSKSLAVESKPNSPTREPAHDREMPRAEQQSQATSDLTEIRSMEPATVSDSISSEYSTTTIAPQETNLTAATENTSIQRYKPHVFGAKDSQKESKITQYLDAILARPQFSAYQPKVKQLMNQLAEWRAWIKEQNSQPSWWWILCLIVLGASIAIILGQIIS